MVPFTLMIELVGLNYKTLNGILFEVPWAIGEIFLGLLAIGVRDYRWYQTVLCIPCVIMLGLLYFVPESPRWLIQKGRYKEAQRVIQNAANFNKVRVVSSYISSQLFSIKFYTYNALFFNCSLFLHVYLLG